MRNPDSQSSPSRSPRRGRWTRWAVCALLLIIAAPPERAGAQEPAEAEGIGDKTCWCWVGFEEDETRLIPLETGLVFEGLIGQSQKKRECSRRCSELCRDTMGDPADLCSRIGRPVSAAEVDRLGCFSVVGHDDNDNNKWDYDGRPCAGFQGCEQVCDCPPGTWYDANRGSCVRGACDVPGMPNGDKGGGYFAWQQVLYLDVPGARNCTVRPTGSSGDGNGEPPSRLSVTTTQEGRAGCDRQGETIATVTIRASGGTAPYTLDGPHLEHTEETAPGAWEVRGVPDGEHTWTVTDAAGQSQEVTTRVQAARVDVEVVSVTPPSCCGCSDGAIEVRGVGDGGPFTYRWNHDGMLRNPRASGLAAGTHLVSVFDDHDCFVQHEVHLPRSPECPDVGSGPGPGAGPNPPLDDVTHFREADLPVLDLGTRLAGREYPTKVTARNESCRGRQDFRVEVEGAPWLRVTGSKRLANIRRGREKSTEAVIDLRGVDAGQYRGVLRVRCETCPPGCVQDRQETEVRVVVR